MTIRFKLTMGFIAVILVLNTLLSLITVKHVSQAWMLEVQNRVRLDLNSARAVYLAHLQRMSRFLEGSSLDSALPEVVAANDHDRIVQFVLHMQEHGQMDIVALLSPDGRVLHRAHNPGQAGDSLAGNPVVARAIRDGKPASGTIILPHEELVLEGVDLAQKAAVTPLPTPEAEPSNDKERVDGMAMAVAVPILQADGRVAGVLYGADLLNRRYELVDAIRNQVFPPLVYKHKDVGTVTIFQADLRISTNVLNEKGERAVGTRMSDAVSQKVLTKGETFADRAFVVNDWHITAYEPILDPTGKVVGALYVGLLEAPFASQQRMVIAGFLVTVGATSLASLLLLFLVTKLVLSPIGSVIDMSHKVVAGDLTARVAAQAPGEMGELCRAVNAMADAVAQREEQFKQATRRQISQSEKLASIGRLAAGVAHEINNPLTGVLTFAHLLREKTNMDNQDQQDLDLIIHETTRVAEIVSGLLDFARERPPAKTMLDLNQVIRQTIRLFANQSQFKKIQIEEHLAEGLPLVNGDRNQLQQVILNLALNAGEAMPKGGSLTITTQLHGKDIEMNVTDTGTGIKPEHLDQIFDPFFTTKPVGKGTGLGLSVSYGIIQQHGGALSVESEEGKGTTFTVILPFGEEDESADEASAQNGEEVMV